MDEEFDLEGMKSISPNQLLSQDDAEFLANLKPEDLAPAPPLNEFMEELSIYDLDKEYS